MADAIAYERGITGTEAEVFRVEVWLRTAFGPLPKTWYCGTWHEARDLILYAQGQGGCLVRLTQFSLVETQSPDEPVRALGG